MDHTVNWFFLNIELNWEKYKLRLDSKVFVIKKKDTGLEMEEVYAIKRKIVGQKVAYWSPDFGLQFHKKNLWERRQDLRQTKVVALYRMSRIGANETVEQVPYAELNDLIK